MQNKKMIAHNAKSAGNKRTKSLIYDYPHNIFNTCLQPWTCEMFEIF